jgi:nitrogen fixation NifU-like protein
LKLYVKVESDRVTDVKQQIRGRSAAMAVASALSELAIGKPDEEDALFIADDDVVEALGGLPEIKLHCSNLGASALQLALKDCYGRRISKR